MREEVGLVVLFISTFVIVLPVLCSTWRHSVYYRGDDGESSFVERDDSSASYLAGLTANDNGVDDKRVFLLVTIVTVRREGQHYLSRVVGRLHQLLSIDRDNDHQVRVLICNVDSSPELHREAVQLERIYPVVDRFGNRRERTATTQKLSGNLMDQEKEDYVFCLNASRQQIFKADYILVLEDDAVPLDDLLPVTRRFIDYLNVRRPDFFYVKLYHPERLQGYWQPEPWRIAEWLAVSVLSVFCLTLCLPLRRRFFWIIYFMALVECMGRTHWIQLRRLIGPTGYNLLAATECCTPAMLFSRQSAKVASTYLSSITCRRGYAKDTALYHYVRQSQGRLEAFVVEPNLVQHIGLVSTLRY